MKLRAVVIGCGQIGFFNDYKNNRNKYYGYTKNILKNKNYDLVGVSEIDIKKIRKIKNIL